MNSMKKVTVNNESFLQKYIDTYNTKHSRKHKIVEKMSALGIRGGKPNCGLVAVALVAQKPLEEVTNLFRKMFKRSGNWRGRTSTAQQEAALIYYGVNYKSLDFDVQTLKSWILNHADSSKQYIIGTTGHVQTVENGLVVDQRGCFEIDKFWGKQKRIDVVFEIISGEK